MSLRRGIRFWRAHAEIDDVSEGGGAMRGMLPEYEGYTSDAEVNLDAEQQEVFLSKNNNMVHGPYETTEQAHKLWDRSLSRLT